MGGIWLTPRDLWDRGLQVIPVPAAGNGWDGKTPAIYWTRYQYHRVGVGEIRKWFNPKLPPINNAIVTGALSGVVVVDIDGPEALQRAREVLPTTPWFVKTAKGYHAYYRHPGGRVANIVRFRGLPVDVRGDGGYVMGPGSVHRSGYRYQAVGNWNVPRNELPEFPRYLFTRPTRTLTGARKSHGSVRERARRYLEKTPCPPMGSGSDMATFVAACRLVRGFALDPAIALGILREWALPEFDTYWLEKKIASALSNGRDTLGNLL